MKHRLVAAALLAAFVSSAVGLAASIPPEVAAAVSDPGRPAADKAFDANRKPAEAITFSGVRQGMVIAELAPGHGYYTRILAKTVGPKGRLYALVSKRPGATDAINAIAKDYPNVIVLAVDYTAFELPEKADLFWTTENYHDFHNGDSANVPKLDKSVLNNLKPSGWFYIEDHSAANGAGVGATSTLHRMDEEIAKQELVDAGFAIDAEGAVFRNKADDRTKIIPEGYSTDRFMIRAKRP